MDSNDTTIAPTLIQSIWKSKSRGKNSKWFEFLKKKNTDEAGHLLRYLMIEPKESLESVESLTDKSVHLANSFMREILKLFSYVFFLLITIIAILIINYLLIH